MMNSHRLTFLVLALLWAPISCTEYRALPGSPDARSEVSSDRPSVDRPADLGDVGTIPGDGGACPDRTKLESCGDLCQPCPVPANAEQATCDGKTCGFVCKTGFHACGTQCVDDKAIATCGKSCDPCVAPTGGTSTCDGTVCGGACPAMQKLCAGACVPADQACSGVCPAGKHDCNGLCLANTSVASCGATACSACAVPSNGAATCDGTACGITCNSNYKKCGDNRCVPMTGCCTAADCTAPGNGQVSCSANSVCEISCGAGFHNCNGACVSNNLLTSCGTSSCSTCPAPAGGSATCDGQSCGFTCPAGKTLCGNTCITTGDACNGACASGTHNCSGTCRSDTDPNYCGTACERCTVPQNATATCNGACGVKCNTGFNLCGNSCKASTDPTACGPSCTRCDVPTGGSATCNGTTCGTPTCPSGQKICNNACIDNARSCNGVCSNGKYNCPDGVCRDTNTVASCGTACQTCPNPGVANAAAACQANQCGFACNAGFERCGTMSRCQANRWTFEDGTVQGFVQDTVPDGGSVRVISGDAHGGTRSLSSEYVSQFDGELVYMGASVEGFCGAGLAAQSRTASAWVKLAGPYTAGDTSCRLDYATAPNGSGSSGTGQEVTGVTGQWLRLTVTIADPIVYKLWVRCFTHASVAGTLRMNVDDVAIE